MLEKLEKIKTTNEYINGFKNYTYFNFFEQSNLIKEFINPHKIYEETNKERNISINKENINTQNHKNIKIPELSPECKELIKYNLFGTNISK